MVSCIAMVKGITTDKKSKRDHTPFKDYISNDIDAHYGKAGQYHR